MNFLDYLVNAMTGGQPTQQELMARQMAQQGLLNQQTELMPRIPPVMTPEMLRNMTPPIAPPTSNQGPMSQQTGPMPEPMRMTPEMINEMRRNMTPPISGKGQMADQYRQNLFNPGMTMQQNYIDPRLIEQMYYKGLLSR